MLTVAAALSVLPQLFVIRTQYVVAMVRAGVVKLAEFIPTGWLVSPLLPWYHWYLSGVVPVGLTASVPV